MTALRALLKKHGVTPKQEANMLPEWWDDEIALNPVGFLEAHGHIAINLGLDIRALRRGEVVWDACYKR